MLPVAAHLLSRTSSTSSVCSNDSRASIDTNTNSLGPADVIVEGPKRTRKRFTSLQLMMLEHLYHKASHPTREQREQLAKDAEISDVRSVTVWFQNKRQTDRRLHRQLSEPATIPFNTHCFSSPAPSTLLPPSSPFSDASGKTIHTVRARTLSSASIASSTSMSSLTPSTIASGRKRERGHESEWRHVRQKPSRHLSLDAIAARTERPVLIPRTPPQCIASSSSPARLRTPEPPSEDGSCSSPPAPDPARRSERDLVRYGKRRYTLEYACAREMLGGKARGKGREKRKPEMSKHSSKGGHREDGDVFRSLPIPAKKGKGLDTCAKGANDGEDDDQEIPVLEWDLDALGDTDTEGVPSEAITPSSSFGMGELSVADKGEDEKENRSKGSGTGEDNSQTVRKTHDSREEDLMDVAYVLCGLSQRC
ncbi:hypothetical protein ONZ51_g8459 [Trametes cubensis]|uniref:Homeobox domain-containing protein n=1 Tax=Trametes cubensis TaxID=1111947 RepID=A0AAD7TNN4_9APHY|nr:hypothetical protein ONZ51_g8459 [Trametes cubensis]